MPRASVIEVRASQGPRVKLGGGPYVHVKDPAHRAVVRFPCHYCPYLALSERGRTQHIARTLECRTAQARRVEAQATLPKLILEALERQVLEDPPHNPGANQPSITVEPLTTQPTRPDVSPSPGNTHGSLPTAPNTSPPCPTPSANQAPRVETVDGGKTFIQAFPDPRAGVPINDTVVPAPDLHEYIVRAGNLANPDYFDTAELLMTTGLTNAGRDAHLKSRLYKGNVPWANNTQLMRDIDCLPHGPAWSVHKIPIKDKSGVTFTEYLFSRDIVEIVRDLLSNPAFRDVLRYSPERQWTAEDCKIRIYEETWSGDWWWKMQITLPDKSATIVPLIIAADRTKLSALCGGQQAYPVYVTIGNIPKSIRRKPSSHASVLLGYLPVDLFRHVKQADERARLTHELTHRAMEKMMEPLVRASKEGVEMVCADGRTRRVYPIVAAFVGDWPEQCGMAGVSQSGCPTCKQKHGGRGAYGEPSPLRTKTEALAAYREYLKDDGDSAALDELGLKPWIPWWVNIPYANLSSCIMPDLLHQLHQGMVRSHAIRWAWSKKAITKPRVDACFRTMPKAEGMRHFARGISTVKQWTGRESKEAEKQLLPVVASLAPDPDLTGLVRTILEFTYRAQACRMTECDVSRLEDTLVELHQLKAIIVKLKIFESLDRFNNIPKLHMLSHYAHCIHEMGTPDGYSTESPEHLHIIYAKRGWRASNKVEPLPQMVRFVQRYEALRIHRAYMVAHYQRERGHGGDSKVVYGDDEDWDDSLDIGPLSQGVDHIGWGVGDGTEEESEDEDFGGVKGNPVAEEEAEDEEEDGQEGGRQTLHAQPTRPISDPGLEPDISFAIWSTAGPTLGRVIATNYQAPQFVPTVNTYLKRAIPRAKGLSEAFLAAEYHTFEVWHKAYLIQQPLEERPEDPRRRDVVRAKPNSGTFDTVLFLEDPEQTGIRRYRAGRLRVIFKLPTHLQYLYPHPLVYLETFTRFSTAVTSTHGMHTCSQDLDGPRRRVRVLPLFQLAAACHLAPQFQHFRKNFNFGTNLDLLAEARHFYLNHYYNHHIFFLVDHWKRTRASALARQEELARAAKDASRSARKASRMAGPSKSRHRTSR